MKHIVNFGAGVNSTAMIIEMVRKKMPIDYVIFADTGSELPETYEFLTIFMRWLHDHHLKFVLVKSKYGCSVYDYYYKKKMTPSRQFRDCTDKFKKMPIHRFLKQFKDEGVTQYIGIASDEARRCRTSNQKWIEYRYPLVSWLINRKKCIEIIKSESLPEPIKSGCFMCPYQSDQSWLNLMKNHQDLWDKSKKMEQNGSRYPEIALRWKGTLKQIETADKEQISLKEYENERTCDPKRSCDGFCMT
jgi:3'-phosphoadenosine 5'-phosphosulfate sulfotransferase (PAPS reductase)/FAD synthetase